MAEAKVSRAWLLNFGHGLQAAVGAHEMSHVLLEATLYQVPLTPWFCNEVMVWQGIILPVMNVPSLIEGQSTSAPQKLIIGIGLYQDDPQKPAHYCAFHLLDTPESIYITDDQACELPVTQLFWKPLATSAFSIEGKSTPIIDFAALFSEGIGDFTFKTTTKRNRAMV